MKHLIRSFLIYAVCLWAAGQVFSGVVFTRGYETLIVTAAVFGLVNIFIRPLINLLLLPINLITLGTFRWLVNVGTLLLVTMLVTDFQIIPFFFPGAVVAGFPIPAMNLGAIPALIVVSVFLSITSGFLFWLAK